jgi:hypothetical protein
MGASKGYFFVIIFLFLNASGQALATEEPAAQEPVLEEEKKTVDAFTFADFSWLNGNSRQTTSVLVSKYFTGTFIFDANYVYSLNQPQDHTLDGSCETGRTSEIQIQQLGIGGDFHYANVRGRLMTQFGMYSQMTPRNDSSPSRGQWNLTDAYKYLSEAYGGYHFDVWNGINVDAGIFMSYVGLFSYYNYENWAYQPSYVSANTPWFFNGVRIQAFPSEYLKVELWLVNGWQSYGMFNEMPGLGFQIAWRPNGNVAFVSNGYYGDDTLRNPARARVHSDSSIQIKYHDTPKSFVSKAAFSFTFDAGCENGGGVTCGGGAGGPAQNFVGFMLYNRIWLDNDLFGITVGGGAISNPGRYLVLVPPINGATASNPPNSSYFSANPGDPFTAWDASVTVDYMPSQFITLRAEFIHRQANVAYFAGPGGMTPPAGSTVNADGTVSGWSPNLVNSEDRFNLAMLVRF